MRRKLFHIATLLSVLVFFVALLWPAWPIYRTSGSLGLTQFRTHRVGLFNVREFPGPELVYYPSLPLVFLTMALAVVLPICWCISVARRSASKHARGFEVMRRDGKGDIQNIRDPR
jgi:hypothetical protein